MLSSITYRPASTVPSSDMCCETTLRTRTIIAEVACVGPFPSVGSHMCCDLTLLTRTIIAEVACVGPFPSVGSHMFCETALLTRTIRAEVACVGPFPSVGSHVCCTLRTWLLALACTSVQTQRTCTSLNSQHPLVRRFNVPCFVMNGFFTSVCSHMFCETTLHTRTIRAEVACVGPFPSVGSHMCCETTLRTRTIRAELARVGPFPSVGSHVLVHPVPPVFSYGHGVAARKTNKM